MAGRFEVRPAAGADYRAKSKFRTAGLVAAVAGLMLVMVSLIGNSVAGNEGGVDAARKRAVGDGLRRRDALIRRNRCGDIGFLRESRQRNQQHG